MRGFKRKRGNSWELRVFLGNDPLTGKQRYRTKSVRCGKREAERILAEMVVEAERGVAPATAATVGELLEEWFELASRDFSPKTVKETRGFIDRNLLPTLGPMPLAKLTTAELDRFYRSLQQAGGRDGRPLAPATVRRIHGILRRALTQGVLRCDRPCG
ncbi:MAG: N-terminal phage integrase SAM-like domain-containing protein [Actinomycetota bacterium]